MKKVNFVTLLLSVIGGIPFALGLCMVLLTQWNAFRPGVVLGAVGAAVLLAIWPVRRKMKGKPAIRFTLRALGTTLLAAAGTLGLGVGMCMTMVWDLLIPGIAVGLLGIVLLLCLIPLMRGLN